jgi:hypothetical protein
VYTGEDLLYRDHLGDIGLIEGIILKYILKKWHGETWTGLIWLRIETGGGLF